VKLLIQIPGASELEIGRGIAAAQKVFDEAGTTPHEAAAASFKRDGEAEELTDREAEIAHLWDCRLCRRRGVLRRLGPSARESGARIAAEIECAVAT
jgi:hypothetical protein